LVKIDSHTYSGVNILQNTIDRVEYKKKIRCNGGKIKESGQNRPELKSEKWRKIMAGKNIPVWGGGI